MTESPRRATARAVIGVLVTLQPSIAVAAEGGINALADVFGAFIFWVGLLIVGAGIFAAMMVRRLSRIRWFRWIACAFGGYQLVAAIWYLFFGNTNPILSNGGSTAPYFDDEPICVLAVAIIGFGILTRVFVVFLQLWPERSSRG